MTLKNSTNYLKKIKVDAAFGKKKHFNAADRKQRYYTTINLTILIINGIIGILLFVIISFGLNELRILPLVLAVAATILTGFQIQSNYSKTSEGHRNIGNRYLSIFKRSKKTEAYLDDGLMDKDSIIKSIDELTDEINTINSDAEAFPTSKNDYDKSKKGIDEGEELYTEDELDL